MTNALAQVRDIMATIGRNQKKELFNMASVKDTYSKLSDIFIRKLMQDLYNDKIEIEEFRRISRGMSELSYYLDFKGGA